MSCVREGSLEPPYRPPHVETHTHGEGRTGRFLRGLRRMFKRRGSGARVDASPDPKSSSTSELIDADSHARRKEGAYGSGLSVSHDSVFTGERSGDESSDERATHHVGTKPSAHRAELVAAVRRRGRGDVSDDDEDLGLPRSPPASPPTDKGDKRHHAGISQSSCSDGSLLSVGSSEMDDDSSSAHHHSHDRSDNSDLYNASEPPTGVAPLSHSAAKHKMAVRPRRTHGAPRRKKTNAIAASALPITPELNEEMIRSATPDVKYKPSEVVTESFSSSTTTRQVIIKEQQQQIKRELHKVLETSNDTKLKSSSLPPGLALNQLVGNSPAKLSIAEQNTPRSSVKRSKSSSQGQSLRDTSPKTQPCSSETKINIYHSEERIIKYKNDNKYSEESYQDKKTKSEKKIENENIKSKKEESFFSRLLLRKSGKKTKKDQTDGEAQIEVKKSKNEKVTAQYKPVDAEKGYLFVEQRQGYRPTPAERTHKSAGQKKSHAIQVNKRIDNRGAYVQENMYKDIYSAAKVSGAEYNITDLKIAEETDKMLNSEMKTRLSRRDEYSERTVRSKRTSSTEAIEEKREPFNLHHDKSKRPISVQKLVERDPFSTKAFIVNERVNQVEKPLPSLLTSDDGPPLRGVRINKPHNDCVFHSGSMPKNLPYFSPNIVVSSSMSPPKTCFHKSSDNVKFNRSSEQVSEIRDKQPYEKREKNHHLADDLYIASGQRSLGEEYIESRSSIGKSHSFRYASESTSISSQENQLPSLPTIVGISEPLLESWETTYRRNISERHDSSKRVSARNYNIFQANTETNFDSLPSTDSSYLDSLKNDMNEDRKLFTNNINLSTDTRKRDSDISQIEAKIDDIISSPKPLIAPILKSSSLDSVQSSPEKPVEDRRKTISIDISSSDRNPKNNKIETDNFVSVTHLNIDLNDPKSQSKGSSKSDEKINSNDTNKSTKSGVPEFLNIQLNKVDSRPSTNVVLTANVSPKKIENTQTDKKQEHIYEIAETKISNTIRKESTVSNKYEHQSESYQSNDKISPVVTRRAQSYAPQSPSTPKNFFKRKATSVDLQDKPEKSRTNSVSTDGSNERIFDSISMDQKSHSSFGSKSSIQSSDSNDHIKIPDRNEEVVYRKKPIISKELRTDSKKKDDEPELMKVFARRSLKLKDSEAEILAAEIAESQKRDSCNDNNKTKSHKNEFNASIKSRDSDKENDETAAKDQSDENKSVDIAAIVSQFGVSHYQRSVSISSVTKRESAPVHRNEVSKYKKEVSDSTPEKRLRNRTFPDPANDREDIKNIGKKERDSYKADTLTKKTWQKKDEEKRSSMPDKKSSAEKRESAVIEGDKKDITQEKVPENEADDSPQFKGILQMRAEWERRAKQGMTK